MASFVEEKLTKALTFIGRGICKFLSFCWKYKKQIFWSTIVLILIASFVAGFRKGYAEKHNATTVDTVSVTV